MVTQVILQDFERPEISEGNAKVGKCSPESTPKTSTFINKNIIVRHERIDEVEDLLGALRFSCGIFAF
jgi:hypothetical protein